MLPWPTQDQHKTLPFKSGYIYTYIHIFTYLFIRKLIEAGHTIHFRDWSLSLSIYSNPLLLAWFMVYSLVVVCFPQIFLEVFPEVQSKLSENRREPPRHEEISGMDHLYVFAKCWNVLLSLRQNPVTVNLFLFAEFILFSTLLKIIFLISIFVLYPIKISKHP